MLRNFRTDVTKREIKLDIVKRLQGELQNHYEWYLCERNDEGEYEEREELCDEEKMRLEVIQEIAKGLEKMLG